MDNDEDSNYRKSLLPHVFGLLVIFGRFGGDFGRKNEDFDEKLPFWEILAFFLKISPFWLTSRGAKGRTRKLKEYFFAEKYLHMGSFIKFRHNSVVKPALEVIS